MKASKSLQRALSLMTALALALSLVSVSAFAAAPESTAAPVQGSVINTSNDGGADSISLAQARSFKGMVPVSMTEAEALEAAKTVSWSLLRDESKTYQSTALYPNQNPGGPLESWMCSNGETPMFTNVTTSAETVDGQVYLTVTFDAGVYFYSQNWRTGEWSQDPSAPHSNGGAYTDVCGYFDLTALNGEEVLGAAPVKVAPYDNFHLMSEVYAELDRLTAYAKENTGIYVEKFSMGSSAGSNGLDSLDMPYLIVAKDRAAVDKWLTLKAQAESDPAALIAQLESGALTDYQVPVMYSNVHSNEVAATDGILKFAWLLVETAAGEGKIDYDKLTGFTAAGEAELASQMGPVGEADSVAVPDLVKDSATYLGYIRAEKGGNSAPVDLEKYYTIATETVDLKELLNDVFFIIVPEENVEGRTYLTRTSSGGFDLNRDNSFQTQAETRNMTQLIAQWNPVSFTEFHGRVQTFQCEPCDPPHEPNFEYDLLAEHLIPGGEALGIAAVANNDGYNSYVIPQRDYLSYTGEKNADGSDQTCWYDPWDDMSTSYTPQYAMLHGTVAYTVEVPAYNDHTTTAVAYGQLGQSDYIAANKAEYLLAQTKILERGVTNANSNAYELVGQWFCDQYDIEGAEADLFRPVYDGEGQNGNFYPECYIIPVDGANQSNLQAAYEMVEYLTRNGVKVNAASKAFTYNGVEYPAGTIVVSMYQAKRSVANGVLYDGTVITEWPVLYSEGITAFGYTRGFDLITCAEPAAYKQIMDAVSGAMDYAAYQTFQAASEKSWFTGAEGELVVLHNASEASTAAVNALLAAGKSVSIITEGECKGSFLCSYEDWKSVAGTYVISGTGVAADAAPAASALTRAPVIYICGKPGDNGSGFVKTTLVSSAYEYNYDRQAMALLGFATTDDPAKADLIIGAAAPEEAALAAVRNGTPYIGYGRRVASAAASLFEEDALVRETVSSESMDALGYVTYPTDSLITASYVAEGDDVLYGYGAGYFAAIPEGADVLVQLDGSKDLLEGFLCSTGEHFDDFLNDSVQAIAYQGAGKDGAQLDVVLFANTLTNKVHQRDEFNFVSNAAFAAVMDGKASGTGFSDVAADAWYAEAVNYVVNAGLFKGIGGGKFAPEAPVSYANLCMVLYRMAGSPEASQVESSMSALELSQYRVMLDEHWYTDALVWSAATGVNAGDLSDNYATVAVTRQELVVMLYRFAELMGQDVSASQALDSFSDSASVSEDTSAAMQWAVAAGIVKGENGTLDPAGSVTRAETAAMFMRYCENAAQ